MEMHYAKFLLLTHLVLKTVTCQRCNPDILAVQPTKTGVRMTGYTIVKYNDIGPNTCFMRCIRRPRCYAFNYNLDLRQCEVSEKPAEYTPETYFRNVQGYVYVEIDQYRRNKTYDPCTNIEACQMGEYCMTLETENRTCVRDVTGWEPIFVICSGIGVSAYGTYYQTGYTNSVQNCSNGQHFRSSAIDIWNSTIDLVKVELIKNEAVQQRVIFDGKGSDRTNWFAKHRLMKSSYVDLNAWTSANYVSIYGYVSAWVDNFVYNRCSDQKMARRFFINKSYGGCWFDYGWLLVSDSYQNVCDYERKSLIPLIVYSTNPGHCHLHNKGTYTFADALVISVKYDDA